MMLSIDILPIPTDEAVHEVEPPAGRGNQHHELAAPPECKQQFSAVVPYDMELQRKEKGNSLTTLTTLDQRMMFAVLTMKCLLQDTKGAAGRRYGNRTGDCPKAYVSAGCAEISAA